MRRLVLASSNPGKLREFHGLLAPLQWDVVSQTTLGIGEAEEPHMTFLENALAKARHVASLSGLPALADDSGLCVPALGGEPGVQSARYAGEPRSDQRNNDKLVQALASVEDRRAFYVCVLVFVESIQDPVPLVAEGRWAGEMLLLPRGDDGFGYDPLFYLPELGCTAAELPPDRKNRMSHRAQALAQFHDRLRCGVTTECP